MTLLSCRSRCQRILTLCFLGNHLQRGWQRPYASKLESAAGIAQARFGSHCEEREDATLFFLCMSAHAAG